MKYEYNVYHEGKEINKVWMENRARKITDPVTITIRVELDRSKYDKIITKYKTPIGEKILKIFG